MQLTMIHKKDMTGLEKKALDTFLALEKVAESTLNQDGFGDYAHAWIAVDKSSADIDIIDMFRGLGNWPQYVHGNTAFAFVYPANIESNYYIFFTKSRDALLQTVMAAAKKALEASSNTYFTEQCMDEAIAEANGGA